MSLFFLHRSNNKCDFCFFCFVFLSLYVLADITTHQPLERTFNIACVVFVFRGFFNLKTWSPIKELFFHNRMAKYVL